MSASIRRLAVTRKLSADHLGFGNSGLLCFASFTSLSSSFNHCRSMDCLTKLGSKDGAHRTIYLAVSDVAISIV